MGSWIFIYSSNFNSLPSIFLLKLSQICPLGVSSFWRPCPFSVPSNFWACFWVLCYFLFTVSLNTDEIALWNYINPHFFIFTLDCFRCIGWTSCFIISFEDSRLEETYWESHDWFTGIITGLFEVCFSLLTILYPSNKTQLADE